MKSSPFCACRCEFHVSRRARDRYGFNQALFGSTGNVVFADFHAARIFADRMNRQRDLERHPEQAVKASEINAMGLIDEMLHAIMAKYRETVRPTLLADTLAQLERDLGTAVIDEVLRVFVDEFPPLTVYRDEIGVEDYLDGSTNGVSNRELALEELVLLRFANSNPAFAVFRELFDDTRLSRETRYQDCVQRLEASFAGRPGLEEDGTNLLDLLLAPVRAAPTSLEGQLAFIRGVWAGYLGEMVLRVLSSLDFVAEETKPFFGFGPGPVEPPDYGDLGDAPQRFSTDLDWMPRVVLLAKNVHVWLDQLSRRYEREISTLDLVPDEELDRLGRWGFTGLWLIGVWERSRASERIKKWMGDEEAVASAYSLADYRVAGDLGGEEAYDDLKNRAWRRGIRLSTDMVPNHMGIDSRWVIEHPDWFIGLDRPPFPGYRFTGADLCDDERVGVYLEDRYWNRSDAAVVFKRVDHWTGDERFIYHGNDGTTMPWNDTAQLDYRIPEVREAVIQTILHVARRSPIIRFDAAMTLAKKHYHRLWFPEPGSGGDIPSRAEHGMTRAAFDQVMPEEFWREVVDRVAAEAPDTLLLAEAFWLLEGYFVRTLGMHRVYNSAFMNMLRDERNADYRLLIKSTLEYDPQILKRYVNFMSNPDERTAVDQFGTDGKYFGVATMMSTLPGLPMFGHGQVEGFAEKYGMEFRRPRWDEHPDEELIRRHERQLFPLLHRRAGFAEVDRFLLYDLEDERGKVDENVFAYSNEVGGDRSLVIFHNTFADTRGWLRRSTAKVVRGDDGSDRLERYSLAEGLGVTDEAGKYLAFRDAVSGLEYLRPFSNLVEQGIYVELDAYRCHVFLDFRDLEEDERGRLRELEAELAGGGTDSIELALGELDHRDILEPFAEVFSVEILGSVIAEDREDDEEIVGEVLDAYVGLLEAIFLREAIDDPDFDSIVLALRRDIEHVQRIDAAATAATRSPEGLEIRLGIWSWILLRRLGGITGRGHARERAAEWFDGRLFARVLERTLAELGGPENRPRRVVESVRLLLEIDGWWVEADDGIDVGRLFKRLTTRDPGRTSLGINRWDGELWYRAEAMDELLVWLELSAAIGARRVPGGEEAVENALNRLRRAHAAGDYRVSTLTAALEPR